MFPLVALGIAFLGGGAAAVAMAQEAKPSGASPATVDTRSRVSPQSYLVTPVGGGGSSLSAVDTVRKFIV
jgi:hypothetical protein